MDVPAVILQTLKCEQCGTYLSRGPVYLQHVGTAVCGCCVSPERPAIRMLQYESLAKLLRFPCRNQDLGCTVTVPFVNKEEVIGHEEVCEHRQYVCPVLGSACCDWLGTRAGILQHCSFKHPDHVLQNPCTFTHDIIRSSSNAYLLTAFQVLFLVFTKVCLVSGRIYHAVRHLGSSEEATNYEYNLDIKRGAICLCKPGDVAPQGCLAIQEPTSLAMNTNSLLEFLGGFDGTTFTVTVKRRVSAATEKTGTCVGCKKAESVLVYFGEDGWKCQGCSCVREFKNQGYIDTKCGKQKLDICDEAVSQCSSAHYDSEPENLTYRAGSTWRMTQAGSYRRCLVSSVAGIVVCRYWLTNSQIILSVFTPMPKARLREFRCEVRLTDPATGNTCAITPITSYTMSYDWHIDVCTSEFSSWSGHFDVCIEIIKEETNS